MSRRNNGDKPKTLKNCRKSALTRICDILQTLKKLSHLEMTCRYSVKEVAEEAGYGPQKTEDTLAQLEKDGLIRSERYLNLEDNTVIIIYRILIKD